MTYITAWLKYYYPVEFFAALLSFEEEEENTISFIHNARDHNIQVLQPDINKSHKRFVIEKNGIRFGLKSIKGLGDAVIDEIVRNQPYESIEDLIESIPKRILNKTRVAALIYSGALDSLAPHASRHEIVDIVNEIRGTNNPIDNSLDILEEERKTLGVYLSGHPLEGIAQPINWNKLQRGERFTARGKVVDIRMTQTRRTKAKMCFIDLEVLEGIENFVVFPKQFRSLKWKKGILVEIYATKDEGSHIVETAKIIE